MSAVQIAEWCVNATIGFYVAASIAYAMAGKGALALVFGSYALANIGVLYAAANNA